MTTLSNSYLKITEGHETKSDKDIEDALLKEKQEKIKNYTKIAMGKVIKNSNIVNLSCVLGIIPGQPITGFGIKKDSYVVEVNYNNNSIIMNNVAEKTSSHTIITVNNLCINKEEEKQYYNYTHEGFIQNY
jgi:hypothetical protein